VLLLNSFIKQEVSTLLVDFTRTTLANVVVVDHIPLVRRFGIIRPSSW